MMSYSRLPESSEKDRAKKISVAHQLLQEYSNRNFGYRLVEGISLLYPSFALVSYSLQTSGNHTIPLSIASVLAAGGTYRLLFKDEPEKIFETSQQKQGRELHSQVDFHVFPLLGSQDIGLVLGISLSFR